MTENDTDQQKAQFAEYVKVISSVAAEEANADLLAYVIDETYDRAILYLNRDSLPGVCNRVIARVVSSVFDQTHNNQSSTSVELAVSSVSDNGQSVSYANEVQKYLATTDDEELFRGFAKLLAPYRRPNVVS